VDRTNDATVPQSDDLFEGLEDVALSVKCCDQSRPFLHALEEIVHPALALRPMLALPLALLARMARLPLGYLALAAYPHLLVQHAKNLVVVNAHRKCCVGQKAPRPGAVVDRPQTTRVRMFRVAQRRGVLDDQHRGVPEASLYRSADVPGQDLVMRDLGIRQQPVDSFRLMSILRHSGNARRGILNQCRSNPNSSFGTGAMPKVCF
jgi:hypothetical protein